MAKWDYIRLRKHHLKHRENVKAGWRSEDAYKDSWDSGKKHDVCGEIPKAIWVFLIDKEGPVAKTDILAAVGHLIPDLGKPKIEKVNHYLRELGKQKIIKSVERA